MSAVNSLYHIVINTYRREMTIPYETSEHSELEWNDYRLT